MKTYWSYENMESDSDNHTLSSTRQRRGRLACNYYVWRLALAAGCVNLWVCMYTVIIWTIFIAVNIFSCLFHFWLPMKVISKNYEIAKTQAGSITVHAFYFCACKQTNIHAYMHACIHVNTHCAHARMHARALTSRSRSRSRNIYFSNTSWTRSYH